MNPFCTPNYVPYYKKWIDKKSNKTYNSITLTTMQLPCFSDLHDIWYLNGKKVIPLNIKEMLTPLSLAHFIMGDGSKQNDGIHLSVYSFSKSDVDLLIKALYERYNIESTIHMTDNGPRIYINKNNMKILIPLIINHIVPSMRYKISL